MSDDLVSLADVSASVRLGNGERLTTVRGATMSISIGRSYAIVGKSGSGKTSLVSILGLLNREYTGTYLYRGHDVATLSDRDYSRLRARNIGFVFQNYSLIQHLSVGENVSLALQYSGVSMRERAAKRRMTDALDMVGLADRIKEFPSKLSGGEQQRVAIARALVVSPELLICDEPTGALDAETSTSIMTILAGLVAEQSTALVLVTHDSDVAELCHSIYTMDKGVISYDRDAD